MTGELKIDTLQSIEVAEGVDILLRPAGPLPRAYAYALDVVIRILMLFAMGLLLSLGAMLLGFEMGKIGSGLALIGYFLLEWGYYVVSEAIWGTSLGKKAFKLKVVRTSGVPVGWGGAGPAESAAHSGWHAADWNGSHRIDRDWLLFANQEISANWRFAGRHRRGI